MGGQARCHVGGGGEAGWRGGAMWASRRQTGVMVRQIGVTDQARVQTGVVGWARCHVGVRAAGGWAW